MRRALPLLVALVALVALAALVAAAPAFAHVSVTPREAARGSTATLTFRVPNERDDASTVKVEIDLPAEQPIANAEPRAPEGWTVEASREAGRVSRLTWTAADGVGLTGDGTAAQFEVTLGPVPSEGDTVVFRALQTYSDGAVVRWIDVPPAGGAEPDHPAPVLRLTGPPVTTTTAMPATTVAPATSAPAPSTAATGDARADDGGSGDGSDAGPVGAIVGLGVLAIAIAIAVAVARRRRPSRSM